MISKLILCYELSLEELQETINFLAEKLQAQEILCLRQDELTLVNLEDYSIYCFHYDLKQEINTHSQISKWLLENDYDLLNPYLEESNIFDNKFLFAQFLKSNQILHPETFLYREYDSNLETSSIVKACHGTEKRDFANYSKEAITKIKQYDDVLIQRKIDIKSEVKILHLNGELYSDSKIEEDLKVQIVNFSKLVNSYTLAKENKEIKIFSIDILEDQDSNFYFLELNLRPNALYRFKEKF